MILNNVTTINGNSPTKIQIKNGEITPIVHTSAVDSFQLTFDNALVFPGLVNAHDHLDFNLFPQLGSRVYNNYTEWGNYIHDTYQTEIQAVLKVPLELRVQWGIFKNLLCGVTTVVNHGERLTINNPVINVHQGECLHSVQFEKKWRLKLNNPLKIKAPVTIHIGEGTDEPAHNEIDDLIRWNLLKRKLIGIHGVAMSEDQAKKFEALVWCPESNYFLLNQTAHIDFLKKHTTILFGTDSTLTGNWNIWDHIRLARKTKMLTDNELYDSLHLNASAILKTKGLNKASVVVARKKTDGTAIESFFLTDPADILLVTNGDHIRLFDEVLLPQLDTLDIGGFSKIYINGVCKYVQGDLPQLIKQVKKYYPDAYFPVTINCLLP
jgi:hypothetical protein